MEGNQNTELDSEGILQIQKPYLRPENEAMIYLKFLSWRYGFANKHIKVNKTLSSLISFSKKYKLLSRLDLKLENFTAKENLKYMEKIKILSPKHDRNTGIMLSNLKALKLLDFSWVESTRVSSKYLLLGLSKLKSLNKLTLRINHNTYFKLRENSSLYCKSIKNLPLLEEIEIKINSPIDFFISIWKGITTLNKIKKVRFDMSYGNILGEDILACFNPRMKKLKKLESFQIIWKNSWRLKNTGLEMISKILKKMSLRDLQLDFEYNFQISDEGFSHLSESLLYINCLRSLHINLSCENISNRSAISLIQNISTLQDIEKLFLGLKSRRHRSDEFMKELPILSNMINLKSLELDVSESPLITKDSLIYLEAVFVKSKDIKIFKINLSRTGILIEHTIDCTERHSSIKIILNSFDS